MRCYKNIYGKNSASLEKIFSIIGIRTFAIEKMHFFENVHNFKKINFFLVRYQNKSLLMLISIIISCFKLLYTRFRKKKSNNNMLFGENNAFFQYITICDFLCENIRQTPVHSEKKVFFQEINANRHI